MRDIKSLFPEDVDQRDLWFKGVETDELLVGGPFCIKDGCLYDVTETPRYDVIGQYVAGAVELTQKEASSFHVGDRYYYFPRVKGREGLDACIKGARFNTAPTALLNILIGNAYQTPYVPKSEYERVNSIYKMLQRLSKPVLTTPIKDESLFLERLQAACTEQIDLDAIDKDHPTASENRGALRKVSKEQDSETNHLPSSKS